MAAIPSFQSQRAYYRAQGIPARSWMREIGRAPYPRRALAHATRLALRAVYTEDWCVGIGFLLVIYLPLVAVAWIKVGPAAGVAATALFLFLAFIGSQPGGSLFGSGPYSSSSRSRPDSGPTDAAADPAKHRRA